MSIEVKKVMDYGLGRPTVMSVTHETDGITLHSPGGGEVFVEVYNGRLTVHVWHAGTDLADADDPDITVRVEAQDGTETS